MAEYLIVGVYIPLSLANLLNTSKGEYRTNVAFFSNFPLVLNHGHCPPLMKPFHKTWQIPNLSSQKFCLHIYMQQPCCKPTWSHDVTDWTRVIQIHSQMDTLWVSLAVELMKTSLGTVFPLIVFAETGF